MRNIVNVLILLAIVVSPMASFGANQYETEPNNTMETADIVVETGTDRLYGQMMIPADEDWYSITIVEPGLISVLLTVPSYSLAASWFYKKIYTSDGSLIGSNSSSEELSVYGSKPGTYFIQIYDGPDNQYALRISGSSVSSHCPDCGLYTEEDLTNAYDQGYSDGVIAAGNGIYTQEEMDQRISQILTWGDTNEDGKIGLQEVINALQVTVGQ